MRCPNCQQRNSVASRKCYNCASPLPVKPMPKALKIAVLVFVVGIVIISFLVKFALSNLSLKSESNQIVKTEQSEADWTNLGIKIQSFLNSRTQMSKSELDNQLKEFLKDINCEIHVFEINKTYKIVEISKNLFSSLFIVIPNQPKILKLTEINIFDEAKCIEANKQKLLLILGHNASEPDRALKPAIINLDTAEDLTTLYLPHLPDNIKFYFKSNSNFLNAKTSILSLLQNQGLDAANCVKFDNETIDCVFEPTPNGSFDLISAWSDYKLGPIYVIVKLINNPSLIDNYKTVFNTKKIDTLLLNFKTANNKLSNQPFSFNLDFINKRVDGNKNILTYGITTNDNFYKAIVYCINTKNKQIKYFINGFSVEKNPFKTADSPSTKASDSTSSGPSPTLTPNASINEPAKSNPQPNQNPNESTQASKTSLSSPNLSLDNDNNKGTDKQDKQNKVNDGSAKNNTESENTASCFSKINIRKLPMVNSKVLSCLPANGTIKVLGQDNGWYKVKLKSGECGYIYGGLLKGNFKEAYTNARIYGSSRILDANNKTVGKLTDGERVIVLSQTPDGKLKIMLPNGKTGLIDKAATLQNTSSNSSAKSTPNNSSQNTKSTDTKSNNSEAPPQFVP